MRRPACLQTALAAALAIVLMAAPAGAATRPAPTAHIVGPTQVFPGVPVVVQGQGWPARTLVHLQLCGNAAIDGSVDCDLAGGADAGVGANGTFSMALTAGRPPVPCPCVVWISDESSVREARVPITVAGVPVSQVHYQSAPPNISDLLRVTDVALTGGGGWTTWFGAGSRRFLTFSVTNVSATNVRAPNLTVLFGKGGDPNGVVQAPAMGDVAPHSVNRYRVAVNVDALSIGTYTARGQISSFGTPVVFRTTTTDHPWGLFVVALVLVQLLLLAGRNRLRRRLHRESAEVGDGSLGTRSTAGAPCAPVADPPAVPAPAIASQDDPRAASERQSAEPPADVDMTSPGQEPIAAAAATCDAPMAATDAAAAGEPAVAAPMSWQPESTGHRAPPKPAPPPAGSADLEAAFELARQAIAMAGMALELARRAASAAAGDTERSPRDPQPPANGAAPAATVQPPREVASGDVGVFDLFRAPAPSDS